MRSPPTYLKPAGRSTSLLVTALALAAIVLAADVSTSSGSPSRATPATPPKGFAAHRLRSHAKGVLKPGSTVKSSALGPRVFTGNENGFALANVKDVTYPAATSDGGKTWKTNGPEFHLPAAQAPLVVTMAGAARPRTDFAWGGPGGGNVINVTSDGGATWWRSSPPGVVLSVIAVRPHKLVAIVQEPTKPGGRSAVTWVYVSKDGGRHWTYDARLGAV